MKAYESPNILHVCVCLYVGKSRGTTWFLSLNTVSESLSLPPGGGVEEHNRTGPGRITNREFRKLHGGAA